MEGPCNVIAGTFSRLLHQDDTSALVGKKAITEDSELASYSLFEDKEIFDCLVNSPCINFSKKRKQLKLCHRDTNTSWHHRHQNHCLHNFTSDHSYLHLPEYMVEDNPLDIENIKEKQDEDNEL